jgi:FemAB-related protein (PEP-CTERM system-associated)
MIEWITEETVALQQELDALVRRLPGQSPYLLSSWRRAVLTAYGYKSGALVWREAGQVQGFLAYCAVKDVLGRSQAVALPYCDIGGPVAVSSEIVDSLQVFFASNVCPAQTKGGELRLQGNRSVDDEQQLIGKKVNMLLTLPDSEEALLAAYPPKLRSQIKKAGKNGLNAEVRTDCSGLDDFYLVYSRNMHRLGSPAHSKAWFAAVLAQYQQQGEAILALVYLEQQIVGGAIVLRCGEQAVIPWASTLAEYNSLAPNMLLYWSVQAWLCQNGVRVFDFGRSTYGEGTYKFKKQWGAVPGLLQWQRFDKTGQCISPAATTSDGKLRALAERVWRTLPEPMMTTLGSGLRRYITL